MPSQSPRTLTRAARAFVLAFASTVAVCAQAQGTMATRSKEYKSSNVPKDIPGQGTETSVLTIADAGPILDLNVKLNITHP